LDQPSRIKELENRLQQLESLLKNQKLESGAETPHSQVSGDNVTTQSPAQSAPIKHTPPAKKVPPPQTQKLAAAPQPQKNMPPVNRTATARTQPGMYPVQSYAASDHGAAGSTVAKVLGFGGAASIILACVYLLRLAYDNGVFTPRLQIGTAFSAGIALLLAGLWLPEKQRSVAIPLTVSAMVVLFLSVAGAHQLYQLLQTGPAIGIAALLLGLSVWLQTCFRSSAFSVVAVIAAYLLPSVIPELTAGNSGAIIWFGGCATAFSMYSLLSSNRQIYISAMYLGLVFFAWHTRENSNWSAMMAYQVLQFAIFSSTAALFSIVKKRSMTNAEAIAHAPALAIFYLVQFFTLKANAPHAIPWVTAGSAAFVVVLYQMASIRFRELSSAIKTIVISYVAIALIHGIYIESVPDQYAPWVGLISGPLTIFLLRSLKRNSSLLTPLLWVTCIAFVYNNISILFLSDDSVPAADLLRIIYAVMLWSGFFMLAKEPKLRPIQVLTLYAGHIQALAACIEVLSDRLQVSLAWAIMSLVCLGLGVAVKSREVGRSALIILAAAGAKAAFYDLDDSQPVLRVACLAVLGTSLFASGWLYTKLEYRTNK
jgi:hypothetical protein